MPRSLFFSNQRCRPTHELSSLPPHVPSFLHWIQVLAADTLSRRNGSVQCAHRHLQQFLEEGDGEDEEEEGGEEGNRRLATRKKETRPRERGRRRKEKEEEDDDNDEDDDDEEREEEDKEGDTGDTEDDE
eukprot:evm.model.NODE_3836_length_13751_cov_70.976944.6